VRRECGFTLLCPLLMGPFRFPCSPFFFCRPLAGPNSAADDSFSPFPFPGKRVFCLFSCKGLAGTDEFFITCRFSPGPTPRTRLGKLILLEPPTTKPGLTLLWSSSFLSPRGGLFPWVFLSSSSLLTAHSWRPAPFAFFRVSTALPLLLLS